MTNKEDFKLPNTDNAALDVRALTRLSSGWVHCEIQHPTHGWIPFVVDPDDKEQSTLDVLAYIKNNKIKVTKLPDHESVAVNLIAEARDWRNGELARADVMVNRIEDFEIEGDATMWRKYRVALRNWPSTSGFPSQKSRPTAPDA